MSKTELIEDSILLCTYSGLVTVDVMSQMVKVGAELALNLTKKGKPIGIISDFKESVDFTDDAKKIFEQVIKQYKDILKLVHAIVLRDQNSPGNKWVYETIEGSRKKSSIFFSNFFTDHKSAYQFVKNELNQLLK